jgi:teichuronic acid biosynthesis glycosyltransferase TuaC
MRVLLVTAMYPTPENPAYGTFVRTQAESLKRAGVDLDVLVLRSRFQKLSYVKGIFQVRRRVAQSWVDVIHAHYSYAGVVARMQRKAPLVVTYHGDDLLGTIDQTGKKTFWSGAVVALGKLLARYADAAIVQSAEMASKLERANVYVLPHEVDLDMFQPTGRQQAREALGLEAGKKYLLFAANPEIAVKRFPLARAVADHLAEQDPAVELIVVSKETQQRLALYMSACDVLIFPSYQEGSPNIIKQAMACNLPIVATDVGDVRQVIGGTNGCYVCNPSVAEFAECIKRILAKRKRTNGREHVRHLDSSAVAAKLIEVYQQVVRRRETHAMDGARVNSVALPK